MKLIEIPGEAWRAMAVNPLRTGLTMLGMVIGVGAVVMMLAIGQGARTTVAQAIATLGSNLLVVSPGSTTTRGAHSGQGAAHTLTAADAAAIGERASVHAAAPVHTERVQLIHGAANWNGQVKGVTPDYLVVREWPIEAGRSFDDLDIKGGRPVAVLAQTVARSLFGEENPVGKSIRIAASPFEVVGTLEPKGQSHSGADQDDTVLIPLTTLQGKLFGNPFPGSVRYIMVKARSGEAIKPAQAEITALLRARHRLPERSENDFHVSNLSDTANTAATTARTMSLMLGAIASLSLLVGGIGIMNIMLVSVTERTREIGIRMAVGARRQDILLQFLTEAIGICVAGGALGTALGIAGAWVVAEQLNQAVIVTLTSILLAFGFSAATGIFFGYYPARKAARMKPVEALRYE